MVKLKQGKSKEFEPQNVAKRWTEATKEIKNDKEREKLNEAWIKGVEFAQADIESDKLPQGLSNFASQEVQTPIFTKHPSATFTIIAHLLEDFHRNRCKAMTDEYKATETALAAKGARSARIVAAYEGWAEVLGNFAIVMNNAWGEIGSPKQEQLAKYFSTEAADSLYVAAASWPTRILINEHREAISEFMIVYNKSDHAMREHIRRSKTHGLIYLGATLHKSTSITLTCSLIDLILGLLPDAWTAKTAACREVFSSTIWKSEQARDLRKWLDAAAEGYYLKNVNLMTFHLAKLGSDRPQPFEIISIEEAQDVGSARVRVEQASSRVSRIMWVQPKMMVARIIDAGGLDELVFTFTRITGFKELQADEKHITYAFLYEDSKGMFKDYHLVVEKDCKLVDMLKDVVREQSHNHFFATLSTPPSPIARPKVPITKYKASRAMIPALDTQLSRSKRDLESGPIQSSAQVRQQVTVKMIEEDRSSSRVASSSPLTELSEEKSSPSISARKRKSASMEEDQEVNDKEEEEESTLPEPKTRQPAAKKPKLSAAAPVPASVKSKKKAKQDTQARVQNPAPASRASNATKRSASLSRATRSHGRDLASDMTRPAVAPQEKEKPTENLKLKPALKTLTVSARSVKPPRPPAAPSSAAKQQQRQAPPTTVDSASFFAKPADMPETSETQPNKTRQEFATPQSDFDEDESIARAMDLLVPSSAAQPPPSTRIDKEPSMSPERQLSPVFEVFEPPASMERNAQQTLTQSLNKSATSARKPAKQQAPAVAPAIESQQPIVFDLDVEQQPPPPSQHNAKTNPRGTLKRAPISSMPPAPSQASSVKLSPLPDSEPESESQRAPSPVRLPDPKPKAKLDPLKSKKLAHINKLVKHKIAPTSKHKIAVEEAKTVHAEKHAKVPPAIAHEALFAALREAQQAIEAHTLGLIGKMEEQGKMARALMIEYGKDAINDVVDQSSDILTHTYEINLQLAKSVTELKQNINVFAISVGFETEKAIEVGLNSRWKWPEIVF